LARAQDIKSKEPTLQGQEVKVLGRNLGPSQVYKGEQGLRIVKIGDGGIASLKCRPRRQKMCLVMEIALSSWKQRNHGKLSSQRVVRKKQKVGGMSDVLK